MTSSDKSDGPELFLGLAAAVCGDLDRVVEKLSQALVRVGYRPHPIW
jgi:hypothetical protein